ncbi:SpoIIE family protein phosphatase [Streptomyces sp. ITFR-16]|uniref:SpoIIE family protein phosphatase n=1 Tax=Streptomyces sp. ITFR-16 TaxID=3075198 RepID=UPI002888FE13|nr:SpoIIE family protein phosphatase [Streptomyces sp. ITFR-16]WNI26402.1 SpoIIE family protein phosphatase [Streptomyces sp. ITFR-16]
MSDAGAPAPGSPTGDDMERALLDTLFSQSAVGLHVLDTQLRVERVNTLSDPAASDRILGLHFTEAYRLDDPEEADRLLHEVLETGEPVLNRVIRGRLAGAPGPDRSLMVTLHRLDAPDGTALGVLAAVVDVNEREKARLRADCLASVRREVGHSLDVAAACEGLVAAMVPLFADFAVVEVVDEVLRGADAPLSPVGADVPLRRAARRGVDGDVLVGETRRLPEHTPFALAAADLRPRLVALGRDTPWLDADPVTARMVTVTGAHSLIVVPLKLHGAFLGVVSLYRCQGTDPYDENDLALALTAAAHTALSIENARRYAHDHAIASTVQRRLLSQHDGARIAIETAHVLLPGRNSGCWFDTIGLSGARTALIIGNVAGHGLQTAITMGQLRTVIHALAGLDLEPDEVLARLNDTADRLARERRSLPPGDSLHRQSLTAACLYAVYDPFTRVCTMARAGRPAPVVVGPDGRPLDLDVPEGPMLFSEDSAPFATASVRLEEGSVLAFLTDSLLPEERSVERVRDALAFPERGMQALCDAVVYHLPAETHPDGAALLLARTGVVPADRVATWELAHDRTTPAVARTLVRDRLEGWNLGEDTIESTELIVSELITNAVRYGTPPLHLRLLLDRTLTCEVHDTSPVAPHLRHARTVDEGGRGLFIVSQLATHWGTRYGTGGKALWTEQEVPPGEGP